MRWEKQRTLSERIASPLTYDEEDDDRETAEYIDRVFLRSAHHASF
jgi:hypothetical protein